jgi:hypothetical protein
MSFLRSEFRVEGSRVEDKGPSVSVIRHLLSDTRRLLEVVSRSHLRPNGRVAGLR